MNEKDLLEIVNYKTRELGEITAWTYLVKNYKLSTEFIDKYFYKLHRAEFELSAYQNLDSYLLNKYKDILDWGNISIYQNLSEEVMRAFDDYINYKKISFSQKLSSKFIKDYKNCLFEEDLKENIRSSKNPDKVVKEIFNNNSFNFECFDNYFIGYISLDSRKMHKNNKIYSLKIYENEIIKFKLNDTIDLSGFVFPTFPVILGLDYEVYRPVIHHVIACLVKYEDVYFNYFQTAVYIKKFIPLFEANFSHKFSNI